MDRGRSETGWKVGEVKKVKKVKEKQVYRSRKIGRRSTRIEEGSCLFSNYKVAESFTVQKVLASP